MTTLNTTPATVAAAMKAAQPGDIVRLESGAYGDLAVRSVIKAGEGVHIEPASGATVDLRSLTVSKSEGVSVRGLTISDPSPRNAQVSVASSSRIVLEDFDLSGETTKTAGVWARFNTDLTLRGLKVHGLRHGVFHEGGTGFVLEDSDFRDLWGDAVRGGLNSDGVTLRRLTITDLHQVGGDHLDAIQFWTYGATKPTRNVLIEDVVYRRGIGDPAQGILIGNEAGLPYENVSVRRVAIAGGLYNGISLSGVNGGVVDDCLVLPMEGAFDAKGKAVTNSWIQTRASTGGLISNSFASLVQGYQNVSDATVEGFQAVPVAKAGDYAVLDAWLKRKAPPVTPVAADPRDALIAKLQADLAAEVADDAAMDVRVAETEAELGMLRSDLKAALATLEIIAADRAEDRAAMEAAGAALSAALATHPAT